MHRMSLAPTIISRTNTIAFRGVRQNPYPECHVRHIRGTRRWRAKELLSFQTGNLVGAVGISYKNSFTPKAGGLIAANAQRIRHSIDVVKPGRNHGDL
jgi:hypothetical protein